MDSKASFELFPGKMFYVGFLQLGEEWIPLCGVSDPQSAEKLDTLFVSRSYSAMEDLLKRYAEKIPEARQTFVQSLLREEIENLLERYGLESITMDSSEDAGATEDFIEKTENMARQKGGTRGTL
jgi:hypothetical protein